MNTKHLCLTLIAAVTVCASARAEEHPRRDKAARIYNQELYTLERFHEADANDDGQLTLEEIKAVMKDFESNFGMARFKHADTNGDGQLSLEECRAQKRYEKDHKEEAWRAYQDKKETTPREQVQDAANKHLTSGERKYVKDKVEDHPKAAQTIKRDAVNNPDKAKTVARSAAKHPERTRYVVDKAEENPKAAKYVYREGKKHQQAVKKAWTHPEASKKALDYADEHPGQAKRANRAAKNHPKAAKKAWNNPGKAKKAAKRRAGRKGK